MNQHKQVDEYLYVKTEKSSRFRTEVIISFHITEQNRQRYNSKQNIPKNK